MYVELYLLIFLQDVTLQNIVPENVIINPCAVREVLNILVFTAKKLFLVALQKEENIAAEDALIKKQKKNGTLLLAL